MVLFQTSSPGGYTTLSGQLKSCPLNEDNLFVQNLKQYWNPRGKALFVAATPDDIACNDQFSSVLAEAFTLSGMSVMTLDVLDDRNSSYDPRDYDLVILSGGHVPTQMAFFEKINLSDRLRGFEGILMGISAGSMNSSTLVYAQPELPGEAIDPNFRRFIPGLGLTDHMLVPHFNMWRQDRLDGLRILEDITYPDSSGRSIYLLNDGSYILTRGQESRLYGEAYLVQNGVCTKICENGSNILL